MTEGRGRATRLSGPATADLGAIRKRDHGAEAAAAPESLDLDARDSLADGLRPRFDATLEAAAGDRGDEAAPPSIIATPYRLLHKFMIRLKLVSGRVREKVVRDPGILCDTTVFAPFTRLSRAEAELDDVPFRVDVCWAVTALVYAFGLDRYQ